MSRSIEPPGPKTLYFKHSLLPHAPWLFLASTRRFDRTVKGPISGLVSSERSVFDRTLVRQAWQRHLLQVRAVDTLVGELVARMKQTGLWDRALLVVMPTTASHSDSAPRIAARSCRPTRATSPPPRCS